MSRGKSLLERCLTPKASLPNKVVVTAATTYKVSYDSEFHLMVHTTARATSVTAI